ncbi:MAG: YqgE/AlgH family protein [Acidimicrobiia bacterium]
MVAVLSNGDLLVATPTIVDPNFARTVVLICRYGPEGAVGVVLNRGSAVPVDSYLPQWADLTPPPGMVGIGGPVEPESAIGMGGGDVPGELWTPVADGVGLVDLHLHPEDVPGLRWVRVFAGYAGWGPGQLDDELDDAGWFVVRREDGDVANTGLAWSGVLRRQRSDIAFFADYPLDPSMN